MTKLRVSRTGWAGRLAVLIVAGALLATGCTATPPASTTGIGAAVTPPARPSAGGSSLTSAATGSQSTTVGPGTTGQLPTADQDPPPLDPAATPTPPPADPTLPATLQMRHDTAFASLLTTLSTSLRTGDRVRFLTPFSSSIVDRVGLWFSNTTTLGVSAVRFAKSDDYSSGATDSPLAFTRTVVLGIRTPYDDDDSMAGIPYLVGVSMTIVKGRPSMSIITWEPKYLGDPMNCRCTLSVVHSQTVAIVFDPSDPDLVFWSTSALAAAGQGIPWTQLQMLGSGLVAPKGQVIFLADKPFHWFLTAAAPAQTSNITVGLMDALGPYPGTSYSNQSRIVIMLATPDGTVIPNDEQGREYATDVITHESTHQLMNRNSHLTIRTDWSPPVWAVEGIAVAVETLYRDSLGDSANIGYPEPKDPKNTDPSWFRAHLGDQLPTRSELYSPSPHEAGYYAIAGSVFRYLDGQYGYPTMMRVAGAVYARPAQNPFAYFPDPAAPYDKFGAVHYLSATTAQQLWKTWFAQNYEQ